MAAVALLFTACRKQSSAETVVYSNDFEAADLHNITNGAIELYNGTHVLGRYNTSFFELSLSDLPKHDLLKISFDLYIHDSWDGNRSFSDNAFGPDIWQMAVDSSIYINTTFCNDACPVGFICPPQSYPQTYPANNNPRTGAFDPALPGACSLKSSPTGSALYKIEKTIDHTNASVVLKCLDHLKERFTTDPKCAESWSIDNLKITAIQ